jgi:hypothetical protein
MGSDSIFTFIPKNACSSMRYSIAINNGFISGPKYVDWIHANNLTLVVNNINVLLNPRYSFVILRCPYRRLVSVFFDKFLRAEDLATSFANANFPGKDYEEVTFQDFVRALGNMEAEKHKFEQHWRPQSTFLLYENYDRYFSTERLAQMPETLKREIGFDFYDSRAIIGHHTGEKRTVTVPDAWSLKIAELRDMAATGLPTATSMFSDEMRSTMQRIYKEDFDLYFQKFGADDLLFGT